LVYVASAATDPTYAGEVVAVSLSPLAVIQAGPLPASVGHPPACLALSGDGTTIYVGSTDGTISSISLKSGFVTSPLITLPAGTVPSQMRTLPGTTGSFVVSTTSAGADAGTWIYNGALARPNFAMIGQAIAVNSSGAAVYGFNTTTGQYTAATVSALGLAAGHPVQTAATAQYDAIHVGGSSSEPKIVVSDGTVLDAASGDQLGKISLPVGDLADAAPVPGSQEAYFAEYPGGKLTQTIQGFNVSQLTEIGAGLPAKGTGAVTRCIWNGPHKIAYVSSNSQVVFASGLP
jgi:hypothetical protein